MGRCDRHEKKFSKFCYRFHFYSFTYANNFTSQPMGTDDGMLFLYTRYRSPLSLLVFLLHLRIFRFISLVTLGSGLTFILGCTVWHRWRRSVVDFTVVWHWIWAQDISCKATNNSSSFVIHLGSCQVPAGVCLIWAPRIAARPLWWSQWTPPAGPGCSKWPQPPWRCYSSPRLWVVSLLFPFTVLCLLWSVSCCFS